MIGTCTVCGKEPSYECRRHFTERINALEADLARVTRERDEARDWVRRLTVEQRTLTCAFCGQAYPPGSPTHGAEVLAAHVRICEKHPMREVEAERYERGRAEMRDEAARACEKRQTYWNYRTVEADNREDKMLAGYYHDKATEAAVCADKIRALPAASTRKP